MKINSLTYLLTYVEGCDTALTQTSQKKQKKHN